MAKKGRISVPKVVATLLMVGSDRTCCVCHERGKPIQIHHIDEDPSNNDPNNLAVLCLHCHEETQISGGFGRRLDAAQVTWFRDDWNRRVETRREAADKIALAREAGPSPIDAQLSSPPFVESGLGEVIRSEDYAERILGRWLGPRKYLSFYADGRWGIQRNEDAPIEIDGRRWQIEGNKLLLAFRGDIDLVTAESTITSFTTKQFITEANGHKQTYDWAP